MRRFVWAWLALTCLLQVRAETQSGDGSSHLQGPAHGKAAISSSVTFAFERPGLVVPKFTLKVFDDGTGVYEGDESPASSGPATLSPSPQHFERAVAISHGTVGKLFALARELNRFNANCGSKAKNVADTGRKVLTYQGPEGEGRCTYNYSDSKEVQQLTTIFQGMAETMDEGRSLDHMHRYDRLGLDAAISSLAEQVTDGRAIELGNIAASLQSIAGDADLIERVRKRANTLLLQIPPETQQAR